MSITMDVGSERVKKNFINTRKKTISQNFRTKKNYNNRQKNMTKIKYKGGHAFHILVYQQNWELKASLSRDSLFS